MHTFQPFKLTDIDLNPFTKFNNEWALISTGNKSKYNTMTVSWGGLGVFWHKQVAMIFIRESRYTKEFLDSGDLFSISFLDEEYRDALKLCGEKSGRDVDKFAEAGLTPCFRHNIPYPDEANLVLLCNKLIAVPLTEDLIPKKAMDKFYADKDMHTMYLAEIIESAAR